MFTKLIATATVSLAALTTSAVAEGSWVEAIAKAEAYEITTGSKGFWVRGENTDKPFKQLVGTSGFMFGNVLADDVVLPRISDIGKVLEAIEAGSKPIIVASNDWILPSNAMLCEIAAQLQMECALFTEMFYRYSAKDANGNYDESKGISNLKELEASVVSQVEALGLELDITENGVSVDALNAAIAALEADAVANAATITVLEAQVEALTADASVDADKIAALNVELAEAVAKQEELQAFLETTEGQLTVANAAHSAAVAEVSVLETKVESIKAQLDASVVAHQASIDELVALRESKDTVIAGLQADINALVADRNFYMAQSAKFEALSIERYNLLVAKNDTIDSLVSKIQDLESYKSNSIKLMALLNADLDNLQNNYDNVVSAKAALTVKYDNLASDYAAQGNLLWETNTAKVTALFDLSNEKAAHNATKATLQSVSNQLDQAKASKAELDAAYAEAIANANTLGNTIVNLNNQVSALTGQVSSKSAKLLAAQDVIYAAKNVGDFLAANLGTDPVTINSFEDVVDFLEIVPVELWGTISSLSDKNTALTNSNKALTLDNASLVADVAAKVIELNDLTNDLKVANGEVAGLKLQLADAEAEIVTVTKAWNAAQVAADQNFAAYEEAEAKHQEAQLAVIAKGTLLQEAATTIQGHVATIASLEATIASFDAPAVHSDFDIITLNGNNTDEVNAYNWDIYQEAKAINSNVGDTITINGDLAAHNTLSAIFTEGTGSYVFTGDSWKETGKTVDFTEATKDLASYDYTATNHYGWAVTSGFSNGKLQIESDGELLASFAWVDFAAEGGFVKVQLSMIKHLSDGLADLMSTIEADINDAYNDGYADGYNEGFKDGYATGYADAKAGNDFAG